MSSSREQSAKPDPNPQEKSMELDPQSFPDMTANPSQSEIYADVPELKGPPRRPVRTAAQPPAPVEAAQQSDQEPLAQTPTPPSTDSDLSTESLGQQPIPPPSEPMQYRAIGLIKGKYQSSDEQFNRGELITEDGTHLDAVLLGQVMSLVKKYLDLDKAYLWVVYPRTREKEETLHMQIVGVWSAEGFGPMVSDGTEESQQSGHLVAPLQDGYFSVRGEIVFHSPEKNYLLVKIQQSPRRSSDRPKAFKLKLTGDLQDKTMGYFWDFHVQRQGEELSIAQGHRVALVPPKKRSKRDRQDSRKPKNFKPTQFNPSSSKPRPVSKPIKKRSAPEG